MKVQNIVIDDESHWDEILASTIFVLRATIRTTMQHIPAQLVFRRDVILKSQIKLADY